MAAWSFLSINFADIYILEPTFFDAVKHLCLNQNNFVHCTSRVADCLEEKKSPFNRGLMGCCLPGDVIYLCAMGKLHLSTQ